MSNVTALPTAHRDVMGLSSHQVMAAAGISYRQLDFWVRAGHVPGERLISSTGTGNPRVWSLTERDHVVTLARLVRAGINVRAAAQALQSQPIVGQLPHTIRLDGDVTVTLCAATTPAATA